MRLTRRGRVAGLLVVLAIAMGWQFGARSLNAVAVPVGAALVVGAVSVYRGETPTIALSPVDPGDPGDTRRLAGTVEGSGFATVGLQLPAGLGGATVDATTSLPGGFEREIELTARGVYTVGPATIRYRDPLGLVERRAETAETTRVVVYPRRYEVSLDGALGSVLGDESQPERQSFDRIREYEPGDPLRNVHWKTSAKHEEFHVVEFEPTERPETVTIAAASMPGRADEMAEAAASIARAALDAGLDVEVVGPQESLPPGQGTAHWENLLGLLARAGSGSPADGSLEAADIRIRAVTDETAVRTATSRATVSELRERADRREVPA